MILNNLEKLEWLKETQNNVGDNCGSRLDIENRYFPDPENPDIVLQLIEKYGAPDMVFGGVGINGHYAFNEPPYGDEVCSNEEFRKYVVSSFLRLKNIPSLLRDDVIISM